jgi:pimeloyl-ACP methyl ester carboxylesterase
MFTLPDQYITVDGVRTRYWDAGNGPVVLLLHGALLHVEMWYLTIPALLPYFRVVAFDMMGHGLTDKHQKQNCDIELLTQFTKSFMDQTSIDEAHVVGHSGGGAIAVNLAILFPNAVDHLVLQDPGLLGRGLDLSIRLLTLPWVGEFLFKKILAEELPEFYARWRASMVDSSNVCSEFVHLAWAMRHQPDLEKLFLKSIRQSVNIFGTKKKVFKPLRNGLASIPHPTLVVWGVKDRSVPVSQGINADKLLPNSRLELLENCGHSPCLEKPDQFNQILLDFLLAETETVSGKGEILPAAV